MFPSPCNYPADCCNAAKHILLCVGGIRNNENLTISQIGSKLSEVNCCEIFWQKSGKYFYNAIFPLSMTSLIIHNWQNTDVTFGSMKVKEYILVIELTHRTASRCVFQTCVSPNLFALSEVYIDRVHHSNYLTVWQSKERLGETHVWKTLGGAVHSITNIYSLMKVGRWGIRDQWCGRRVRKEGRMVGVQKKRIR